MGLPLVTQDSVRADAARELAMYASNDAHFQRDELTHGTPKTWKQFEALQLSAVKSGSINCT